MPRDRGQSHGCLKEICTTHSHDLASTVCSNGHDVAPSSGEPLFFDCCLAQEAYSTYGSFGCNRGSAPSGVAPRQATAPAAGSTGSNHLQSRGRAPGPSVYGRRQSVGIQSDTTEHEDLHGQPRNGCGVRHPASALRGMAEAGTTPAKKWAPLRNPPKPRPGPPGSATIHSSLGPLPPRASERRAHWVRLVAARRTSQSEGPPTAVPPPATAHQEVGGQGRSASTSAGGRRAGASAWPPVT
mmetsp:Transcript_15794/g.45305  ORF Transcript_15794/g.45305 Transcript_15794/m.45305 type:complete len:241 (-) Transcript_15794:391-1113(-)